MDEIRELASQVKIVRASPVNPTPPSPQYLAPLGYGVHEPHSIQSNLIEAGRQDWTANNPNIVFYNCETSSHYEFWCWKPRVAPEIRAENV